MMVLRIRPPFPARLAEEARGADWLMVDFDGAWPADGPAELIGRLRAGAGRARILVRAGPEGPERTGLGTIMAGAPDGIWLADAVGRRSVAELGAELAVQEAEHGLGDGATGIVASIESARGALRIADLPDSSPRLLGLAWHAGLMRRDLGLAPDGAVLEEPLRQVGAALVLAARAGRVPAIDTPHGGAGKLADAAAAAKRDGYAAKIARDPAELAIIAKAFRLRLTPASGASG